MAGPCIADTACISLSLDGSGNLIATPIILANGGLTCFPAGLSIKNVPGGGLDADFDGEKILNDPNGGLTSTVLGEKIRIDPNTCNEAYTTGAGLYVRKQTTDVFTAGGLVGNGTTGVTVSSLGVTIDVDAFAAAYPSGARALVNGSDLSFTNNTCRNVNLRIAWKMGPVAFALCNGWWMNIGTLNSITAPSGSGTSGPSIFLNTADSPLAAGKTLSVCYPPSSYERVLFIAPGESVALSISLFAQLYTVGPASGSATPNAATIFFGQTIELECWTS